MRVKIRDYPCFKGIETKITPEIEASLGLKFPQTYLEAEPMAKAALAVQAGNDSTYAVLPFCHTVEGDAFGGKVNYGDARIGPRGAEPILNKLEEVLGLADFDLENGRIKEVLDAVSLLKKEGAKVMLEVSGPVTVLNIVIDPKEIFINMRKQPELMAKVYEKLSRNLIAYMKEAWRRGVDMISYADSAAAVDIIGSRMLSGFVDDFVYPFFKKLEGEMGERDVIHLCPKTAYALIDCEKADVVELPVDTELTYGETLELARGKERFIGCRCINNIKSPMLTGKLDCLKLK